MTHYWLFKTEPDAFSLSDLAARGAAGEPWDGIRNYQARNFLRDEVKVGDEVFIYHSSCKEPAVVGIAEVIKAAHPDALQFDPDSRYFDAKSTPESPRWVQVQIAFKSAFKKPVTLKAIKNHPALSEITLLKRSRLSVMPIAKEDWQLICQLGN